MKITLQNIGKKFRNEWIFRNVNLDFLAGESYTFVGPNGSGKSTLLQVILGILPQTDGTILYSEGEKSITIDDIFRKVVIAAPYLELVEEFTLAESIEFHQKFKPFTQKLSTKEFAEFIHLDKHLDKPVKNFSSGMKQRFKLGLAFHSDVPIIMLDEPTSNLDAQGIAWYLKNIEEYTSNKLVLICSNLPHEYSFCKQIIDIRDLKS